MKITKMMTYEIYKPIDITRKELYEVLNDLSYAVWKTANITIQMTWDYQNLAYEYKQRFGKPLKFSDLGTGRKSQATDIYDRVRKDFPFVSSTSLDLTIRDAQNRYKEDLKEILAGKKAIPSYKRGLPIPIRGQQTKLSIDDKGHRYISVALLSREGGKERNLPTRVKVGIRTGGSAQAIFDRIVSGEYKLGDSKILRKGKKWYFSLAYSFTKSRAAARDKSRVMGVDLGIVNAVYMGFNFDDHLRYSIGGDEIIKFRQRIEARRRSMLKQSKYASRSRRGRGRKTLLKPIEKLRGKVDNFRRTTNHGYSRYIVDTAVKHDIGIIQLEDLSGINNRSKFLKQWSYYELQQFIEYKAREQGIEVRYVDPRYTSQRCSKCGHIDASNRKTQAEFACKSCGYEDNADFNAAKNIAIPDIEGRIKLELAEG